MNIDYQKVLSEYILGVDVVKFAYLFGSYADGTNTDKSDIDIAVYLKDTSLDSRLQLVYELSKLTKKDVDLVVLNTVKNIYLLDDILTNSKILKDSEQRVDFELKAEHDILDYKAFRGFIDAA